MKKTILLNFLFLLTLLANAQKQRITVGAERIDQYINLIKGKKIAIVANHSSLINSTHLVDTLLSLGIKIDKIFCPEHGFRGEIEAGELIDNHLDKKTGLPVISLYGSNKKPSQKDLKGIDFIIFDMQDVGVRFYTYISTMHYVMEACAEAKLPLIILDRPNPNGFYVDGPVLDTSTASFIGLHPVPIVHGMTISEYAQMINGEGWLKSGIQCNIKLITCLNYNHNSAYSLPVKPSPNLPNQLSIYLYPSLGLFEGTIISVGRGTDFPFQIFGNPLLPKTGFTFTPTEKPGASMNPPFKEEQCHGVDLRDYSWYYFFNSRSINLDWLIYSYQLYPDKSKFFNAYFRNLAGTKKLKQQIESGMNAESIRNTWRPELENYLRIRKKYLLYPDFTN